MEKLFDTHAHMDDNAFKEDLEILTQRLRSSVERVLVPGIEPAGWEHILQICEDPLYVAALGIHPQSIDEASEESLTRLAALLEDERVVAVGEIGLDLYWRKDNLPQQDYWLRRQIRLAKEKGLPIILHDREAHGPLRDLLDEEDPFESGVILHAFSASAEMATEYAKKGAYISLAGPVTYKNAVTPKEVAKVVPLEQLLIETDSPYLTPHPFRGKRNDPSRVRLIAEEMARLRGVEVEEIITQTTRNARKVFGLAD